MTSELIIRPIAEGDFEQWAPLWKAYHTFYEATVDDHIYRMNFNRLTSDAHPKMNALVAEYEGQLVGLVHYIFHPHNWTEEEVTYLQDLYADPTVRGKGIGRQLIEAVYAKADENGTPTVYWNTQEFNYTARILYDRVGQKTPFIKYARP